MDTVKECQYISTTIDDALTKFDVELEMLEKRLKILEREAEREETRCHERVYIPQRKKQTPLKRIRKSLSCI